MSSTMIDAMIWRIQEQLMDRHGVDESYRLISPLVWYINTGRASAEFLRLLYVSRPVLIARDLAKGGSDQEALERVFKRIGFQIAE